MRSLLSFSHVPASTLLGNKVALHGPTTVSVGYRHLSLVVPGGDATAADLDGDEPDDVYVQRGVCGTKQGPSSTGGNKDLRILTNVTGCFLPGTMTLVLGAPGAGKSALMKILSGRASTHANAWGDITYNGIPRDELRSRLPQLVAYVGQNDTHLPTLTVRETLTFAMACNGGGGQSVDAAMAALGLERCQDTLVGSTDLRGVSGGERKRVTIAEMASFGSHPAVFYDEASNGLDSAATFDFVSVTRQQTARRRATVVMALLQPSPEVVELFDMVLLIARGQVLYHGPRDKVAEYFAGLGCVCPPERDLADYLCDLGAAHASDDDETEDEGDDLALLDANDRAAPPTARELARLWRRSHLYETLDAQVRMAMRSPRWQLYRADDALKKTPAFRQSLLQSTSTLFAREAALLRHRKTLVGARVGLSAGIGLLFGSLFFSLDLANPQVALGLLFAALMFLGLSQTALLPAFLASRDVFYKQRAAHMFRTPAYVVATLASLAPVAALQSLVVGSIVYWLGGFVASARAFLEFQLVLLVLSLVFGAWFFLLASASPSLHVAHPVSQLSFLFFIVFAGFVVAKSALPSYVAWLYWLDPVAWALRALAVSQYRSPELDQCVYHGVDYCQSVGRKFGQYALAVFDVPPDPFWVFAGVGFLFALYLTFALLATLALEYLRFHDENDAAPAPSRGRKPAPASAPSVSPPPSLTPAASSTPPPTGAYYSVGNTPVVPLLEETPHRRSRRYRRREHRASLASTAISSAVSSPPDRHAVVPMAPEPRTNVTPVTLAFCDLWYSVPAPKEPGKPTGSLDLLKGITGYAKPRTMTALMGSSGAGKTTLMDVIAARKVSGKIQGKILLNGHEASDLAIRRCTAYCEQMDVHSESATFREALTFSACLRWDQSQQPKGASLSSDQGSPIQETVREILDLLGLDAVADHIIRGSSMEQMKRLTIGVELAAQPSVLFLDEPTSGLDARAAKLIMDGVRRVADSGRTVVCTIHQPSSEVFFLFDNLLLLQRGGRAVYFGELGHEGRSIVSYFEAMTGVEKIPDGYNPATWMLEVIGAGIAKADGSIDGASGVGASEPIDFAGLYQASMIKQRQIDAQLATPGLFEPEEDADTSSVLQYRGKRAASFARQLQLLLARFLRMYARTRDYSVTRIVVSLMLALILGAVYTGVSYTTYQSINGGVGLIFVSVAFVGSVAFASALPLAAADRAVFYRERAAQTYNSLAYLVASTVIEVPFAALVALLYTAIFFPLVGFMTGSGGGGSAFVVYWGMNVLHILSQTYLAQLLAFALPSVQASALMGVLFDCICFLLMGFNPPRSSIPTGYVWLHNIIPHRYAFAVLVATVFGNCADEQVLDLLALASTDAEGAASASAELPIGCRVLADTPANVGSVSVRLYIEGVFKTERDRIWLYIARFLTLLAVGRVLTALVMRFISYRGK